MIAVVEVERWKEKKFWEKCKLRIHRYALVEETRQCPWGDYRILRVCDRKVRWDQLEKAVPKGGSLLLPKGLDAPEGFPLFEAGSWRENFFHQSAGFLLKQLDCPMSGRKMILADREGKRQEWLKEWIFCSPAFSVISERESRRQALAKELLEEYGVVLLHSPDLPKRSGGLLLDPEGWLRPWRGFYGTVLTAAPQRGKGICLEPSLSVFGGWSPPQGISAQDFLAACLKEGWLPLEKIPCQGRQNGIVISWSELVRLSSESCRDR